MALPMADRRIKGPDGQEYDGTEIGFQNVREHWNEYLLDDGTVVKLKPVATAAIRVEGAYDPNGNPVYIIESTNVVVVKALGKMKRAGDQHDNPDA